MAKEIKLDKEIVEAFKGNSYRRMAAHNLEQFVQEEAEKLWNELMKKYPGLNLASAKINYDTCIMVCPFEDDER